MQLKFKNNPVKSAETYKSSLKLGQSNFLFLLVERMLESVCWLNELALHFCIFFLFLIQF